MKFYNPFKPHIVEFADNTFAVRRFNFFGWEYRDTNHDHDFWWVNSEYVIKYAIVKSFDEACDTRNKLIASKRASIVVGVYP